MSDAQGDINRPALLQGLPNWVEQIPDLRAKLAAGARVADFCCGQGWAAIALALAYPDITVDGYDLDRTALDAASGNAADSGVADRVRFHQVDVSEPLPEASRGAGFDVVIAVECLHDLPQPVAVLGVMNAAATPDAVVLVVDMAADAEFIAPADEIQRALYGFSLLICLPNSMAATDSVATGTVLRPGTLNKYAIAAGFPGAAPIDLPATGIWRLYRLR